MVAHRAMQASALDARAAAAQRPPAAGSPHTAGQPYASLKLILPKIQLQRTYQLTSPEAASSRYPANSRPKRQVRNSSHSCGGEDGGGAGALLPCKQLLWWRGPVPRTMHHTQPQPAVDRTTHHNQPQPAVTALVHNTQPQPAQHGCGEGSTAMHTAARDPGMAASGASVAAKLSKLPHLSHLQVFVFLHPGLPRRLCCRLRCRSFIGVHV